MKHCGKCNQDKSDNDFAWKNKKVGLRQSVCRNCKKVIQKAYYERAKDSYIAKSAESKAQRRREHLDFLKQYLETHPCVDCGNRDIRVLQFDHVRGVKDMAVTTLAHNCVSKKRLEDEVSKCEIRCANCHMIKTWPRRFMKHGPIV